MGQIALSEGGVALVDDMWEPVLAQWTWSCSSHGYAIRGIGPRDAQETIFMHRYIMMAPAAFQVDHRNLHKLDNRTCNLRLVRPVQNYYNRPAQANNKTGYKGVCFDRARGRFMATITFNGRTHNLGRFRTAEEAAQAYNEAALLFFKDCAYLNHIPLPPQSP